MLHQALLPLSHVSLKSWVIHGSVSNHGWVCEGQRHVRVEAVLLQPPRAWACLSARYFSRSPSPPLPSFTQSPSPLRSLVHDGQTSPPRPRLVVSRSTCPPLSPSPPHANSFVIGPAVINTHSLRSPGASSVEVTYGGPRGRDDPLSRLPCWPTAACGYS